MEILFNTLAVWKFALILLFSLLMQYKISTFNWSPVTKGKKPWRWWMHKIFCEWGYFVRSMDNSETYYHHLNMCCKYGFNLYGESSNYNSPELLKQMAEKGKEGSKAGEKLAKLMKDTDDMKEFTKGNISFITTGPIKFEYIDIKKESIINFMQWIEDNDYYRSVNRYSIRQQISKDLSEQNQYYTKEKLFDKYIESLKIK